MQGLLGSLLSACLLPLTRQRAAGRTWMSDATVWFRETYQRNFAAPYIRSVSDPAAACCLVSRNAPTPPKSAPSIPPKPLLTSADGRDHGMVSWKREVQR